MIPLFSIRTRQGWGLGEIPDLAPFAQWASRAGFSVLQLLPINEVSDTDVSPYAAVSAFALDPVYLSLDECEDFRRAGGLHGLDASLRELLVRVKNAAFVEWKAARSLKRAAIAVAFDHFLRNEWQKDTARAQELAVFIKESGAWLDDYALFIAWHDLFGTGWLEWPDGPRDRNTSAIQDLREQHRGALLRANWTQWQLDLQWQRARRQAAAVGVELMGDLPFTVGVDSADVWANRSLFRTDRHVGTPPDYTSSEGQSWGLPAYDWTAMANDGFAWIRARASRFSSLFSLYRIDHVAGLYRTYFRSADGTTRGYVPADEEEQFVLGDSIVRLMQQFGEVVAEDLGDVPPFVRRSLRRLGVPGYRVFRWEDDGLQYRNPASWPEASVATNATHDTDTTAAWYDGLTTTKRQQLHRALGLADSDVETAFDDRVRDLMIRVVYAAPSRLALMLFQDAMGTRQRINLPGTSDAMNWRYRAEWTVEELLADRSTTERLAVLAAETGRTEPKRMSRTDRS